MSFGIIFSGQGNQRSGMLPWLSDNLGVSVAFDELNKLLKQPWQNILEDRFLSHKNQIAQPLITAHSLEAWARLKYLLPVNPTVVAGYSVGELAAFSAAEVITTSEAVRLAAMRAECMDLASIGESTGLLSVSGLPVEILRAQYPFINIAIVIDNDHAIVGAYSNLLDELEAGIAGTGVVCKRLDISIASHTPLMLSASTSFSQALSAFNFQFAKTPVIVNATAQPLRKSELLRKALSDQISKTVDWASCMDAMLETGIRCVLEIGPGSALAAIWNRRFPNTPARALEEFRNITGAVQWVMKHHE